MDDINRAAHLACLFRDSRRAVSRVIAADRHEVCDAELRQRLDDRAQVGFLLRRVEAAHLENAAACHVDVADVFRLEADVVLLTARESREAIIDAEHIPAMARRLIRDARDDAVDARSRAAAADDCDNVLDADHGNSPLSLLVRSVLHIIDILVLESDYSYIYSSFFSIFLLAFYCYVKFLTTFRKNSAKSKKISRPGIPGS